MSESRLPGDPTIDSSCGDEGGDILREHGADLRALIENVDAFVLFSDREGRPVFYNRAYAQAVEGLLGVEMRPGFQPHTVLPDSDHRDLWDSWHRRVLAGEQFTVEYSYPISEAKTRWFEVAFNPVRKGDQVIGFSEFTRDITERHDAAEALIRANDRLEAEVAARVEELSRSNQALTQEVEARQQVEHELRKSESRFRAITERSADFTLIVGGGHRLTYASPSVRALGYKPNDVEDMNLLDLVHPDDRGWVEEVLTEAAGRPGMTRRLADFRVRHRSGGFFELEGRVTCLFGVPGVDGLVFNGRDVTERNLLEARVRQAEKMDAIGKLAGGIAHDFNNQLSAIMGNADVLVDVLEDEGHTACAKDIVRATRRASELTRQLLTFARKEPIQAVTVDLHRTVGEVVSLLGRSLPKKIEIQRNLRATPSTILGDPSALQHTLLNLALNARDAMCDGGELTFSTDVVAIDEVSASRFEFQTTPGQYLVVSVEDNGTGMDEEVRSQMFEPFFTTKDQGKGTGMGLASVFGTVINHGGTMAVTSEVGQGTRVDVFLPLEEELSAVETDGFIELRPMPKARVLVVDDEDTVRVVLERMLQRLGHEVFAFSNGPDALDFYRDSWGRIDVVFLDIVMPEMGGGEVFDALKRVNPDVQAVLASGFTVDGEASAIMKRGARQFIQKPFRLSVLSEALHRVVPGARLRRLRSKARSTD